MDEITFIKRMREKDLDLTVAETIEEKSLMFQRALKIIIPPRNQSDRTCFRAVNKWLVAQCEAGEFDADIIFRRILDFALEASGPGSRNPAAVFMSILKKELGYKK